MNCQYVIRAFLMAGSLLPFSASAPDFISLAAPNFESTTIPDPALYADCLEHDPKTEEPLGASFREGPVSEVHEEECACRVVKHGRLFLALGRRANGDRSRLIAGTSDRGTAIRKHLGGPKLPASVHILGLSSGKTLRVTSLCSLCPAGTHLTNGNNIDTARHAYVKDRFKPVTDQTDQSRRARKVLEIGQLKADAIDSDERVYRPDGHLIAARRRESLFFKILGNELEQPRQIGIARHFVWAGG